MYGFVLRSQTSALCSRWTVTICNAMSITGAANYAEWPSMYIFFFLNTFICNYNALLILLPFFSHSAYTIARKDRRKEPLIPKGPIYESLTCKDLQSFVSPENVMGGM